MAETSNHARIYSPDYYERLNAIEQSHVWARSMRRLALDALARRCAGQRIERVLDAGCGTGLFLGECAARLNAPVSIGADVAIEGLRFARKRGVDRVASAAAEALPFPSGSFDVVACNDVAQHLTARQAERAWAEFARVLRGGGVLLIRTAARRGIGSKRHRDSEDYRQWEPATMRRALEAAGFRVDWLALTNSLPSLLADLRAWGKPPPVGDVGLSLDAGAPSGFKDNILAAYWRIESWLLLRGVSLPWGHTLMCLAVKQGRES